MHSQRNILSILIAVCLLTLIGCGRKDPADQARAAGILLVGNGPEPSSLDPHLTTETGALNVQQALFEGLVIPHPETLDPLPGMAEHWEILDDGLRWVFHLRKGAKWSNGKPVTAHDFVRGFERVLNPETGAPYASFMHVIAGAEAYNKGTLTRFDGVIALDDHILEIRLAKPVPHFLKLLLHPVFSPAPLIDGGSKSSQQRIAEWTMAQSFVGNGPFLLKDWKANQFIEVEKNSNYYGHEGISLQGIRFMLYDDPFAEERAFLAGQLHATDSLPASRIRYYRESSSPYLQIDPYLGTYYLLINHRDSFLSNPDVRKALSLSIDREAITDQLLNAGQKPSNGFIPDSMPYYESTASISYNPEKARALLKEAGYDRETLPQITYLFNTSESHRQIGEALGAMWEAALGLDIRLENVEWKTYLSRRSVSDFQIARAVWIGDYLEPSTFLGLWADGMGNDWSGWSDVRFEEKFNASLSDLNRHSRYTVYSELEEMLLDDQVMIPLYTYVSAYLKIDYVYGWDSNLLNWHPWRNISFQDAAELK